MSVTVKKKATAEVAIQKKAKGEVLLETATQEVVETESAASSTDLHEAHQLSEMQGGPIAVSTATLEAQQLMPYCEIGFEASYTHNLGNYESARVNVSIKIPCLHGEIDEAFEYAKTWVDQKLNSVNAELKGD